MITCPCQNNPRKTVHNNKPELASTTQLYCECCQPFHDEVQFPQTAEQLMRSRYSAYELGVVDYITATAVPSQQALLDKQAIIDWSHETDWAGLEIVQHKPKIGKRHAQVEFNALFMTDDGIEAHHALSAFVKIEHKNHARWYFIYPDLEMTVTQKQPCICGSGEKFKRCCGQFI